MIYGGRSKWIDLSHRKYPNTNWFIFVGVEPTEDFPEYWEELNEKIKVLENQQKDFPESDRIIYSYINLDFDIDLVRLIRYFRALIIFVNKQGYFIKCNLTSGIFEIRLSLFLASQIESEKISEIFYINKQTFKTNLLTKSFNISKKGETLLKIIYNENITKIKNENHHLEYNLTDLSIISKNNEFKLDLPSISRLVSNLVENGFLKGRREGRKKYISLTKTGQIFCPVKDLQDIIKNDINRNLR